MKKAKGAPKDEPNRPRRGDGPTVRKKPRAEATGERRLKVLLLTAWLSAVFLPGWAGAGTIYHYVDEKGCVHISNIPNDPRYKPWLEERRARDYPEQRRRFHLLAEKAGSRHRINPDLIKAIIKVESGFDPEAVSAKGALGLMQLMPETARRWGVSRIFDPEENIEAGVQHFKWLLQQFEGNLRLALAAYNAGEQQVLRYRNIPPFPETIQFVRMVIAEFKKLQAQRYKD